MYKDGVGHGGGWTTICCMYGRDMLCGGQEQSEGRTTFLYSPADSLELIFFSQGL